jgi:hypothetical protein
MSRRRSGYIPFWVAIVTVVVGLLVVTGGFVIGYDLVWGQRSIELLRASYLDQVADTAEKGVERLARIGVQALDDAPPMIRMMRPAR